MREAGEDLRAAGEVGAAPAALSCSAVARERAAAVERVLALARERGLTLAAACREAGVPRANFERWRRRLEAEGLEGLEDRTANCGRRPLAVLNEEELRAARGLYVQTGSATAALRMLAVQGQVREEVAAAVLQRRASKHTITPTLRQQVLSTPAAVREWHKSPTRALREGFVVPRVLGYRGPGGGMERILPGQLFERDDMSNNFIFWVEWPWGGDACSDKYGVRIARGQNLLCLDVGSLRFVSMLMLVRLRDSYRADDIWQWVGQTYRDIGMPEIGERWERGVWAAQKLRGTPLEAGHTAQEVRLGGIEALGRRIFTSQTPATKIIENRFRYLQRVCADIPGQIGARRGEMEAVNRLWTQCREGRRDPRDYFPSFGDVVKALEAKLQWVNAEMVEGALYRGVPNEIWEREGAESRLTRLTAAQTYLFSRDRTVVTVTKGHALVRVSAPDGARQAWWWYHPELWREEGRRVALYFDKQAPREGAVLVHAEGPRVNEVIGEAEMVEGCPQFALGMEIGEEGKEGLARRREFVDAVRAEYRALGLRHTVAQGSYVSDGAGRRARIERPAVAADEVEAGRGRGAEQAEVLLSRRSRMPEPDWEAEAARVRAQEEEAMARGGWLL